MCGGGCIYKKRKRGGTFAHVLGRLGLGGGGLGELLLLLLLLERTEVDVLVNVAQVFAHL